MNFSQEQLNAMVTFARMFSQQSASAIPFIEGPKMDWTKNDTLLERFHWWKKHCLRILNGELQAAPESSKCNTLLRWSGVEGMKKIEGTKVPEKEYTLDFIWQEWEKHCKPIANEVRARFDLMTKVRQGSMSVDEWYDAVSRQISLCNYPPETAEILERDVFWFFLSDKDFITKTLSDAKSDIKAYPASKVRQLAKQIESNKATANYLKSSSSTANTQVHLMRHQRTEISNKKKKGSGKRKEPDSTSHQMQSKKQQFEKSTGNKFTSAKFSKPQQIQRKDCTACGDYAHKSGFRCPASNFQCKHCNKTGHFTSRCFSKLKKEKAEAHSISTNENQNAYTCLIQEAEVNATTVSQVNDDCMQTCPSS